MVEIVQLNKEDLKQVVHSEVLQALNDFKAQEREKSKFQVYTINHAAKILRVSHSTLKSYIEKGMLKVRKDKRITDYEINEFLKNQ